MNKITLKSLLLATTVLVMTSCGNTKDEKKECCKKDTVATVKTTTPTGVEYIKAEAPDKDAEMTKAYNIPSSDPNAKVQSPINILTENIPSTKPNMVLNFDEKVVKVDNLGHTIQVDFAPGSSVVMNGIKYDAKQLHFHTPSEHLVNGITYPMEAHLVCMIDDTNLIAKGAKKYLVLGYFYQMGAENNFIKAFINKVPTEEVKSVSVDSKDINFTDIFGANKNLRYYQYDGSLTTPPFTESVSWHVCSTILTASADQIQTINKFMGNNARHIQDANGRSACIQ